MLAEYSTMHILILRIPCFLYFYIYMTAPYHTHTYIYIEECISRQQVLLKTRERCLLLVFCFEVVG